MAAVRLRSLKPRGCSRVRQAQAPTFPRSSSLRATRRAVLWAWAPLLQPRAHHSAMAFLAGEWLPQGEVLHMVAVQGGTRQVGCVGYMYVSLALPSCRRAAANPVTYICTTNIVIARPMAHRPGSCHSTVYTCTSLPACHVLRSDMCLLVKG